MPPSGWEDAVRRIAGRRRRARHAGARRGRRDRRRGEGLRVPRARQAGALRSPHGGATEALLRRLGRGSALRRGSTTDRSIEAALDRIAPADLPAPVPPEKLAPVRAPAPSAAPGRAARVGPRLQRRPPGRRRFAPTPCRPRAAGPRRPSAARPRAGPGTSAMRSGSRPSSVFVPIETVIGRSVFGRSVKQGTPRIRRLLLDPAGVGQHARRAGNEAHELDVAERLEQQQPIEVDVDPHRLDRGSCPRMNGKDDRAAPRTAPRAAPSPRRRTDRRPSAGAA